jgi:hypothetical protein
MRQEETNAERVVIKMNNEGKKEIGRPKKGWLDTTENDTSAVGVCVGDVENQEK